MAGARARRTDKRPPTAPAPSGERRTCDRCHTEPAVYRYPAGAEHYCEPCGLYVAGEHHCHAARARDGLSSAIAELRAAGLTREQVEAQVDADLEGHVRPRVGPDVANRGDPRPWVAHLFERIS